jgi:hypothetical protein
MKRSVLIPGILFFCLVVSGTLFAQKRYALVIGNNNYRNEVTPLTNPVNDSEDIAKAVRELGYETTLITNATIDAMEDAVEQFTANLSRDAESEGFFWFAGHGLSIKEQHYLLPIDVNPRNEDRIAGTSYPVDRLMEEIEKARNKANLIVIDACRNKLLPGNSNRARSVGSRGLAVLSLDDARIKSNKIVYSTGAGKTAADGAAGERNSPFATAFLHNIKSPQTFDDAFIDIAGETLRLTKGEQEPYAMGAFAVKSYSLNPAGRQQISTTQASAAAQASQQAIQAGAVSVVQGSLNISTTEAGQLTIVINSIPYDFGTLPGYATMPVTNISAGNHQVVMRYSDGHVEQVDVSVAPNQTVDVDFQYKIRPIPNAPASSAPAYRDEDAWKNKWLYLGLLGGYGTYSYDKKEENKNENDHDSYGDPMMDPMMDPYSPYPSYSPPSHSPAPTPSYTTTSYSQGLIIFGGVIQFQPIEYFALEANLGMALAEEETYPFIGLMGKLTFRPSIFEIGVGGGYVIGFGAGLEASLGVKLGGGVLFGKYLGIFGGEEVYDAFVNNFIFGYKFGLLDK